MMSWKPMRRTERCPNGLRLLREPQQRSTVRHEEYPQNWPTIAFAARYSVRTVSGYVSHRFTCISRRCAYPNRSAGAGRKAWTVRVLVAVASSAFTRRISSAQKTHNCCQGDGGTVKPGDF